jgi:hypothetical protein
MQGRYPAPRAFAEATSQAIGDDKHIIIRRVCIGVPKVVLARNDDRISYGLHIREGNSSIIIVGAADRFRPVFGAQLYGISGAIFRVRENGSPLFILRARSTTHGWPAL